MEDHKSDGANSTEKLHTEGGYECTIMKHPKTGVDLTIRECFDRWQLVEDKETDDEYAMRKKLLNAFSKRKKNRDIPFHQSVSYAMGENGLIKLGNTYIKEKEEVEEVVEETILNSLGLIKEKK